jgi:hypothetical protein
MPLKTESEYGGIDDLGIDPADQLIAQSQAAHDSWPKSLNQNIHLLDKLKYNLLGPIIPQVQGDTLLTTIDA